MPECRQIAIVGGGPRGLFALDCLAAVAAQTPDRQFAVTLYEPGAFVGAGPVYAPDQPLYLLMNFAAGMIDAWDRSFADNSQRPSLLDWLAQAYPAEADANAYLPRARVGEYLIYCFEHLRADLAENLSLQIEPAYVSGVCRAAGGWQVADGRRAARFDEVLIATGHQRWQRPADARPLSAYPTQRLSDAQDTLAGIVRCKGFGLTFIDTALALTLGRGGRFVDSNDGRLAYRASGHEPACIQPVSRSGRPMLPKPEAGTVPMDARRSAIVDALSAALDAIERPVEDFEADVWPMFCRSADAFVAAQPGETARWFAAWRARAIDGREATAVMRHAWQVATGLAAPDAAVALALIWRAVYPRLVRLISHGGLAAHALDGFLAITMEMERIAFGPAASNIARLLALIDAGVVDLSQLGRQISASEADIDATIPAPSRFDDAGPLPGLIKDEHLALTAFGTLDVDPAGRPHPSASTQRLRGIAIVGRATELSVLGNDTLSRTLHTTLARWATRVCSADQPSAARPARLIHTMFPA
jgi:diaminopimelate decarboxylase